MKKITLSALFIMLSTTAFAASNHPDNGFTDVYNVVNGRVLGGRIVSGSISYQKMSDNQFSLSEAPYVLTGGVAAVGVGQDSSHACILTIQDIDFNVPVLISQQCRGGVHLASFSAEYNYTTITLSNS